MEVFLSVGPANKEQEDFVQAIENRLEHEGLTPRTLGRNSFSADAPLKAIHGLMDQCNGVMVIALERYFYPNGIEKRGGEKEKHIKDVLNSTAWNQIEASMGYTKNLPLMVIVGDGVKTEGLLEEGYGWHVQKLKPVPDSLNNNPEFDSVLASWKEKVLSRKKKALFENSQPRSINVSDMTVREIIGGLKPAQLWLIIAAYLAALAGAFTLGVKFPM